MDFFTESPDESLKSSLEGQSALTSITDAPSDAHAALSQQLRAAALKDLARLDPAAVSIGSFAAMCRQCGRDFLLLLSLGHHWDHSMRWDESCDLLGHALEPLDEQPWRNDAAAPPARSSSSNMRELLQLLGRFCNDEDDGGQLEAQLRNMFGCAELQLAFAASRLIAAACTWGCAGLGLTPCAAADVLLLAAPLLRWKEQRFAAAHVPSVVDLLPLVELLRAHPGVDVRAADVDRLLAYHDAWDRWLQRHPELTAYLDPHHVLVLGPDPAQLVAALAAMPLQLQPEVGQAGAPFPQLVRCQTRAGALAAACALRAHFAHGAAAVAAEGPPLGGVQGGVAAHIAHFTTRAGDLSFV